MLPLIASGSSYTNCMTVAQSFHFCIKFRMNGCPKNHRDCFGAMMSLARWLHIMCSAMISELSRCPVSAAKCANPGTFPAGFLRKVRDCGPSGMGKLRNDTIKFFHDFGGHP
jgi:hypothetical protein